MNDIELNYEEIERVISELITTITNQQAMASDSYALLANSFLDSSGEEADALRSLQKAEKELLEELVLVLTKFGNSISFAANEFRTLDQTGASKMNAKG